MNTVLVRVSLAGDLQKVINDTSTNQAAAGRKLVTCFVAANELVLIFQS